MFLDKKDVILSLKLLHMSQSYLLLIPHFPCLEVATLNELHVLNDSTVMRAVNTHITNTEVLHYLTHLLFVLS